MPWTRLILIPLLSSAPHEDSQSFKLSAPHFPYHRLTPLHSTLVETLLPDLSVLCYMSLSVQLLPSSFSYLAFYRAKATSTFIQSLETSAPVTVA